MLTFLFGSCAVLALILSVLSLWLTLRLWRDFLKCAKLLEALSESHLRIVVKTTNTNSDLEDMKRRLARANIHLVRPQM